MQEYDSYNFLDAFVLNLLIKPKKLSTQEIFKLTQKKLAVNESTIHTCLLLMYMNGLVNISHSGTRKFYRITDEGNDFLQGYEQIKNKIFELQAENP
jgi:DNA-binding PadR family transcriptional regulator